MKINELQIGDWVYLNYWDGKYAQQIHGISYNSWRGEGYADWVDTEIDDEASINNIEPIPLTPEILEKNGWRKIGVPYELEKGIMVQKWKHVDMKVLFGILHSPRYDGFTWNGCDINYVHKLQQTLRLCGLNGLADNIKI